MSIKVFAVIKLIPAACLSIVLSVVLQQVALAADADNCHVDVVVTGYQLVSTVPANGDGSLVDETFLVTFTNHGLPVFGVEARAFSTVRGVMVITREIGIPTIDGAKSITASRPIVIRHASRVAVNPRILKWLIKTKLSMTSAIRYTNPADDRIARGTFSDGRIVDIHGLKDANGTPVAIESAQITTERGKGYDYAFRPDGNVAMMSSTSGYEFDFIATGGVTTAVRVLVPSGQSALIPIDFAKLTAPLAAHDNRQAHAAVAARREGLAPLHEDSFTGGCTQSIDTICEHIEEIAAAGTTLCAIIDTGAALTVALAPFTPAIFLACEEAVAEAVIFCPANAAALNVPGEAICTAIAEVVKVLAICELHTATSGNPATFDPNESYTITATNTDTGDSTATTYRYPNSIDVPNPFTLGIYVGLKQNSFENNCLGGDTGTFTAGSATRYDQAPLQGAVGVAYDTTYNAYASRAGHITIVVSGLSPKSNCPPWAPGGVCHKFTAQFQQTMVFNVLNGAYVFDHQDSYSIESTDQTDVTDYSTSEASQSSTAGFFLETVTQQ